MNAKGDYALRLIRVLLAGFVGGYSTLLVYGVLFRQMELAVILDKYGGDGSRIGEVACVGALLTLALAPVVRMKSGSVVLGMATMLAALLTSSMVSAAPAFGWCGVGLLQRLTTGAEGAIACTLLCIVFTLALPPAEGSLNRRLPKMGPLLSEAVFPTLAFGVFHLIRVLGMSNAVTARLVSDTKWVFWSIVIFAASASSLAAWSQIRAQAKSTE